MGRSMRTAMAVVGVAVLLLTGCDGGDGPPPASTLPTPPASSSPVEPSASVSAPATSDSPTASQTASRQDQDVAEASRAVEEANRIIDEVLMEPDKHKAYPDELKKYADPGGPYWDLQAFVLRNYREEGQRFSTLSRIVKLAPVEYSTKELTLYRCTDATDLKILDRDGKTVSTGALSEARIVVRKLEDGWRVWDYEKNDSGQRSWNVDSCDEDPT